MNTIYTSYFANIRNLPKDIVTISISAKSPNWYNGIEYKQLAPTYKTLMDYKQNKDDNLYIERFQRETLNILNQEEVVNKLFELSDGKDVVILCYEKPIDFCHRHLVADWLNLKGYGVIEFVK